VNICIARLKQNSSGALMAQTNTDIFWSATWGCICLGRLAVKFLLRRITDCRRRDRHTCWVRQRSTVAASVIIQLPYRTLQLWCSALSTDVDSRPINRCLLTVAVYCACMWGHAVNEHHWQVSCCPIIDRRWSLLQNRHNAHGTLQAAQYVIEMKWMRMSIYIAIAIWWPVL